jgi:hypothetical protein
MWTEDEETDGDYKDSEWETDTSDDWQRPEELACLADEEIE